MRKIKEEHRDVFGSMLAEAGLALASVEIGDMSAGAPLVNVFFPKSQHGPDFAYIKDALHENYVIVRFYSSDGREFVEVGVDHEYAVWNIAPKKKFPSKT